MAGPTLRAWEGVRHSQNKHASVIWVAPAFFKKGKREVISLKYNARQIFTYYGTKEDLTNIYILFFCYLFNMKFSP